MPDSSPPSFDAIFEHQRRISASDHNRQSSSSSSNMSVPSTSYGKPFTNGQPMSDEPPPLDGRAHTSSPFNPARERTTSSASSVRHPQNPESRQDSLPWSSTIINTAGQGEQAQANQGQWFDPSPLGFPQYGDNSAFAWPQNGDFAAQGSPYLNTSSPAGTYMTPGSGYASTPASTGMTPGMGGFDLGPGGYTPGTEPGHVKRESFDGGMYSGGAYQGGLGGNGGGQQGGSDSRTSSGEGNVKMEDFMEDLLQTLSRSVSREPSLSFQGDQYFLQQQQNALQPFAEASPSNHISPNGSRPVSPFETAPSPSFASASIPRPSGSSPSLSKTQSPPALNMPNAPSPVTLPPIVTQQSTQAAAGSPGQGHALANQMGGMGGLLPPTNPALQHLTGMMGISPIAPNADGPQIFVQPSTPISGLKDGRGHFDAALRRAAQQAQQSRQSQNGDGSAQQQPQFSVPSPNMGNAASPQPNHQTQAYQQNAMDFATRMQMQAASGWGDLGSQLPFQRPRAKSDSFAPSAGGMGGADFERQAMAQIMAQAQAMGFDTSMGQVEEQSQQGGVGYGSSDWRDNVGAWLSSMGLGGQQVASGSGFGGGSGSPAPPGTVNPNQLPGNDQDEFLRQLEQQHQLSQLQAQKAKMNPLSVNTQTNSSSGIFKYEPGEFSPTSLAFYQQRGMLPPSNQFGFAPSTAPFYSTNFGQGAEQISIPSMPPGTAPLPQQSGGYDQFRPSWLATPHAGGGRRSSFQEGSSSHHATGAGTPGYGMGFERGQGASGSQPQGLSGRVRGVSPNQGHRRAAKSEDFGRGGWGLGHGGSTTEFLNSITANDGSLIPPLRGGGRSHSRQSSVSSGRSASPALSVSSYDSSFSHASGSGNGHMDMPDGSDFGGSPGQASASGSATGAARPGGRVRLSKMKVTSMATEVAATNRRTNSGIFQCPVPGCGSTFTRHFNLKGHMRSHNDERPYKCLYDGCPKAEVGFARQHDCKRHMLLHQGLRPFECEACHKKFARLDALTRHHKSEQGIECAIACPLPTNPDGSAMSESQYKNFKAAQELLAPTPAGGSGKKGRKRAGSGSSGGRSGDESAGGGSGMEDYDRA